MPDREFIIPDEEENIDLLIQGNHRELLNHFDDKNVSVSLKYYKNRCECFSKWKPKELKKFSGTLEKINGYTVDQLKNSPLARAHKGGPSEARFSLPEDISEDVAFWEIKVDPAKKLRVHGFFVQPIFFLVWLDRQHACLSV